MDITIPLGGLPRIVQAGLSLHGHLHTQQFLMHDVWGLHVYFYSGKLKLQDREFSIASGMTSLTPPNTPLEWEFPDHAPHYYVHFIPGEPYQLSSDNSLSPDHVIHFPVMNGPFDHFETIVRDMEIIGSVYRSDPLKAQVCLWNLLLTMADADIYSEILPDTLPSSVQIVVSHINQNYSMPLIIKELADLSGVSHNYLIQLFKKHFDCTIATYIRRKRCQQAEFLLRHSSLSIKSIAQAVGIPDINHFNKTVRKELGAAPSKIRDSSPSGKSNMRSFLK